MKLFSFVLIIVLSMAIEVDAQYSSFKTNKGDQVPSFTFKNLSDEEISIKDFKGQVVLLSFFGSKCPPCLRELPEIQKQLVEELDGNKFKVLAISATDDYTGVLNFSAKHDYDFIYSPDIEKNIFSLFADSSLPRTIVINAEGEIIYQSRGYHVGAFKSMVELIKQEVSRL